MRHQQTPELQLDLLAKLHRSCMQKMSFSFSVASAPSSKTKLPNLVSGPAPVSISIDGSRLAVGSFVYLSSLQSSNGYCNPELRRCMSCLICDLKIWPSGSVYITHPAYLCTTCTSLKSTDPGYRLLLIL